MRTAASKARWRGDRIVKPPAPGSSFSVPATGKLAVGGIREQSRQTIRNLQTILEAAGSDLSHVVMVTVLLHDWKYFEGINEVFAELR